MRHISGHRESYKSFSYVSSSYFVLSLVEDEGSLTMPRFCGCVVRLFVPRVEINVNISQPAFKKRLDELAGHQKNSCGKFPSSIKELFSPPWLK